MTTGTAKADETRMLPHGPDQIHTLAVDRIHHIAEPLGLNSHLPRGRTHGEIHKPQILRPAVAPLYPMVPQS